MNLPSQQDLLNMTQAAHEIANMTISKVESYVELGVDYFKESLEYSHKTIDSALDLKDAGQAFTFMNNHFNDMGKQMAGFIGANIDFGLQTHTEFSSELEKHFDQNYAHWVKTVDENLVKAPENSRPFVSVLKATIDICDKTIQTAREAAKKSTEFANQNIAAIKESIPSQKAAVPRRRASKANV
jgi:hypothetical protein